MNNRGLMGRCYLATQRVHYPKSLQPQQANPCLGSQFLLHSRRLWICHSGHQLHSIRPVDALQDLTADTRLSIVRTCQPKQYALYPQNRLRRRGAMLDAHLDWRFVFQRSVSRPRGLASCSTNAEYSDSTQSAHCPLNRSRQPPLNLN